MAHARVHGRHKNYTKRMTGKFNPREFLNAQHLPLQELKQPSFCAGSKAAKIEAWVNTLQATKIAHTSVVLYNSIPELNKVKTDYENRLLSLEAVRPTVQHCIEGVTKEFLSRPLTQAEESQKYAIIAQALQKAMVDGYLLCLREMCNLSRFKPETHNLLAKALHRAMSGIGLFFFRGYQLYTSAPAGMWEQFHGMYQTAEYYDLLDKTVADPVLDHPQAISLRSAWLRAVMLAACKPNQLSKNDVAHAFRAFGNWAPLVKTNEGVSGDKDNFYIVNISRDELPCYKSRFNGSEKDRVLELDFRTLLGRLSKHGGARDELPVDMQQHSAAVPKDFPDTLLDHLLNTWGNVAQRKLGRREVSLNAEVALGLVDCHYFIAGKRKFEDFVSGHSDWSVAGSSFTPGGASQTSSDAESGRRTWTVAVQNVSTGGYCLLWKGEMPPRLESGELLCLKEQNRFSWNLGVIRWIKQLKNAAQMGVQLLSSHPSPCGAAQLFDMGGQSDFMRALMLPQNTQSNQPVTLITARTPFGEMQKAKILSAERTATVRLGKCLFSTGSIKQFAYTEMEGTAQESSSSRRPGAPKPPESFDSSWDDI